MTPKPDTQLPDEMPNYVELLGEEAARKILALIAENERLKEENAALRGKPNSERLAEQCLNLGATREEVEAWTDEKRQEYIAQREEQGR